MWTEQAKFTITHVASQFFYPLVNCQYNHHQNRARPEKVARVAINQLVVEAAGRGVRSVVLCNSLIYGQGLGVKPDSIQLPLLINQAKKSGVARYIGRGENIWSTVHIEDVVELYLLALEHAQAGDFFFVENGEVKFKDIVEAISRLLGMGGKAESWSIEEAIGEWGYEPAVFALESNSRVRATKAHRMLGWKPKYSSVLEEIEQGSYRFPHRIAV